MGVHAYAEVHDKLVFEEGEHLVLACAVPKSAVKAGNQTVVLVIGCVPIRIDVVEHADGIPLAQELAQLVLRPVELPTLPSPGHPSRVSRVSCCATHAVTMFTALRCTPSPTG